MLLCVLFQLCLPQPLELDSISIYSFNSFFYMPTLSNAGWWGLKIIAVNQTHPKSKSNKYTTAHCDNCWREVFIWYEIIRSRGGKRSPLWDSNTKPKGRIGIFKGNESVSDRRRSRCKVSEVGMNIGLSERWSLLSFYRWRHWKT